MKLSTNNITYAALGFIIGVITLGIGQYVDCETLKGADTLTACGNGESISIVWRLAALFFTATGFYLWISKENSDTGKSREIK